MDQPVLRAGDLTLRPFGPCDVDAVLATAEDDYAADSMAVAPGSREHVIEPADEGWWRTAERAGHEREGLLRRWQLVWVSATCR